MRHVWSVNKNKTGSDSPGLPHCATPRSHVISIDVIVALTSPLFFLRQRPSLYVIVALTSRFFASATVTLRHRLLLCTHLRPARWERWARRRGCRSRGRCSRRATASRRCGPWTASGSRTAATSFHRCSLAPACPCRTASSTREPPDSAAGPRRDIPPCCSRI